MPCAYIIADDLTGALDTGAAFAGASVPVLLFSNIQEALDCRDEGMVAVINANTRHLSPADARGILTPVAAFLAQSGARCYIKTDSGLRGNIGPAFDVFLRAFKNEPLPFVPAYPKLGRTTKKGIHYVHGVPASKSAFASDPLNPVRYSSIQKLLLENAAFDVRLAKDHKAAPALNAVTVYDAETEEDLAQTAKALALRGAPSLAAGCAGFAAYLPGLWGLPRVKCNQPAPKGTMAVFSGTAGSTSLAQIAYAIGRGIPWQRYIIGEDFFQSADIQYPFDPEPFVQMLTKHHAAILTTTPDDRTRANTDALMNMAGLDIKDGCAMLTGRFAGACAQVMRACPQAIPVVFGGDTLQELLLFLRFRTIRPLCELFPGVVLSLAEDDLNNHWLITKSGQFGEEDLILKLAELLRQDDTP